MEEIQARVKHSNLINHTESIVLVTKGDALYESSKLDVSKNDALRMYNLACLKYRDVASSISTNHVLFTEWSEVFLKLVNIWKLRSIQYEKENPSHTIDSNKAYIQCLTLLERYQQVIAQAMSFSDISEKMKERAIEALEQAERETNLDQKISI